MNRAVLTIVLLLVLGFGLAAHLDPLQSSERERGGQAQSFLALVLGEGRALFANEMFAKADAYFHRGNYPSIFENSARTEENHMAGEAKGQKHDEAEEHRHEADGHVHSEDDHAHEHDETVEHDHADHAHDESSHQIQGADWIERFGNRFRVAEHVHLEKGNEREMLPWLKLTSELDPHNVEAYTVAAYWLRERLGKVDEAEAFLRDGIRNNPGNPELLNELGWLNFEARQNMARARNLWRAALTRWYEVELPKEEPDKVLADRIVMGLVQVDLREENIPQAIQHLELLKKFSPKPDAIQLQIDALRAGAK